VSEVVGLAKLVFPCMHSGADACKAEFSLPTLKRALPKAVYDRIIRQLQALDLKEAGIENLIECPFCDFQVIMENENDRILRCLNPACMKESCRMCREPAPIPLRCDEVEHSEEANYRLFIERSMSDALLRKCWRCKKNFFKEEGCNHMTCSCKAEMCYICRARIKGTSHFSNEPGGCPLYMDTVEFNKQEVRKAGEHAEREYGLLHPGVELIHNPLGKKRGKKREKPPRAKKPKRRRKT
jgi:TRIAD3 protein (E3 ubiquitin-protein ligase RNF216)